MLHAREDYNVIQDTTAARKLADLVLSMELVTDAGLVARRLAREVLGITDHGRAPALNPITTNGTTRLIPDDEPVFLVRGQDNVAGATVRAWADMAAANGAGDTMSVSAIGLTQIGKDFQGVFFSKGLTVQLSVATDLSTIVWTPYPA